MLRAVLPVSALSLYKVACLVEQAAILHGAEGLCLTLKRPDINIAAGLRPRTLSVPCSDESIGYDTRLQALLHAVRVCGEPFLGYELVCPAHRPKSRRTVLQIAKPLDSDKEVCAVASRVPPPSGAPWRFRGRCCALWHRPAPAAAASRFSLGFGVAPSGVASVPAVTTPELCLHAGRSSCIVRGMCECVTMAWKQGKAVVHVPRSRARERSSTKQSPRRTKKHAKVTSTLQIAMPSLQVAIKFYMTKSDHDKERAAYEALSDIMHATLGFVDAQAHYQLPSGAFTIPPALVMHRGQTLAEWAADTRLPRLPRDIVKVRAAPCSPLKPPGGAWSCRSATAAHMLCMLWSQAGPTLPATWPCRRHMHASASTQLGRRQWLRTLYCMWACRSQ